MKTTDETIIHLLNDALTISHIELINNSHLHQGHGGWKESADTHYALTLVSNDFESLNVIKRHQLVYKTLAELMKDTIHALEILAYTDEEWKKRNER